MIGIFALLLCFFLQVIEPCNVVFRLCPSGRLSSSFCKVCIFLFGLVLYVSVKSYGHVETVSSPNHTFSWAKIVSMIMKYHNHKPHTTPWHRKEELLNHHETPGRQIKHKVGPATDKHQAPTHRLKALHRSRHRA